MYMGPFSAQAATISIAVTTAASTSVALPGVGSVVRLVNEGPNTAYVSIGSGAQIATIPLPAAASTCCPTIAGSDSTFTIPSSTAPLNISAICATGTAVLRVSVGEGI